MKKVKRICLCCKKEYLAYRDRCKVYCSKECTNKHMKGKFHPSYKDTPEKVCAVCGTAYSGKGDKRGKECCSVKCSGILKKTRQLKEKNPNWKGGRYKSSRGYIMVRDKRSKNGTMPEHRIIMEKLLGRELWPFEIVHHINGIKDDNRPENLEIVSHATHSGEIICPNCDYTFKLH